MPESAFAGIPDHELYIFLAQVPGPPTTMTLDRSGGAGPSSPWLSHRMLAQEPVRTRGGTVRITDSSNFHASKTIAAALVEVEPGGLRELHWHANADEWQYFIAGQARMTVFAGVRQRGHLRLPGRGRRLRAAHHAALRREHRQHDDAVPGDLPQRPLRGHSRSGNWLALTPHELVRAHLRIDESVLAKIGPQRAPVLPL